MYMIYSSISFMISFNLLFCFLAHPMSLGSVLFTQVLFMVMIMGMISSTFWYSYILFLIIVGALLILFIYMLSLIPNEKFEYSWMLVYSMIIVFILSMYFFIDNDSSTLIMSFNSTDKYIFDKNNFMIKNIKESEHLSLMWLYDKVNYKLTISLMMYLLYVLFIIVNLVNINMGTMRFMKN